MPLERVQKILAKAGIASRRKAEALISEGEVTINGKVAKLGDKAELGKDAIKVKGKLIRSVESPIYLAFNKPKGVISAMTDPEGRPALGEYLKLVRARIFPIGRLDFTSEGLLLLTNDGEMAERILKSDELTRVYHVKVRGHPTPEELEKLRKRATIASRSGERGRTLQPYSVALSETLANKSKIEIAVRGAGAMDIKSFFERKGLLVERVVRTAIGHITLHGLTSGKYRQLRSSQMEALVSQPELGLRTLAQSKASRGN